MHKASVAHRFLRAFHRSTTSREFKLLAFPEERHTRAPSIKFFHVSLRSLLRRIPRRIAARALYSLGSLYDNWISAADLARKCVVIARTRENNTADMPFAGHAANYQNPARIINGPFTRHSLSPISIRSRILFVPSALADMTLMEYVRDRNTNIDYNIRRAVYTPGDD